MIISRQDGFKEGKWLEKIDVRDFIIKNYTPYDGDESFLKGATQRTKDVFNEFSKLLKKERENGGVLDVDTVNVSSILSHKPGYLIKDKDIIVGFQTDEPLKRSINPFGGIRVVNQALEDYGYELSSSVKKEFKYRTTHNDGVFRVYSNEMRAARSTGLLTGLPDAYGRGRIIGDYRRVALYGMDALINEKMKDKEEYSNKDMCEENIQTVENLAKQIAFMYELKELALNYGHDISNPATNAKEAVQWLYFGYLGAIKETNGAAMSMGRIITFLDIYFERDIKNGVLKEIDAQEIIDDFVLKLRAVRHLRTAEYNEFFTGDPTWVTISDAGMSLDNRHMVTKTSYRILNSLYTLCSAPEPNMTILFSEKLPMSYKKYCARVSIDTQALQYENDDIMLPIYGDDYGIACCVSAMKIGKQMQYFGARCNLPKLLLMALNGGKDEIKASQVGPVTKSVCKDKVLKFEDVKLRLESYVSWLAKLYVNTMNVIHYMHDKYAYERLQMSLHDTEVERLMAFGISGLSIMADSLSAIKYAKVTPVCDERDVVVDFKIEGDFPKYGNDDERVDKLASYITNLFITELRKNKTYNNSVHTLSALTITSNVAYGKKTGATPDGRKAGEPFAPGANPMHSRDTNGALASLNSVAAISYEDCQDGVSNTFAIVPSALGKTKEEQAENLVSIMSGYFMQKAHHLNVNVTSKETLIEAMNNPQDYPNLTIRVSGYAVNFHVLTKKQQEEVIKRTYHSAI